MTPEEELFWIVVSWGNWLLTHPYLWTAIGLLGVLYGIYVVVESAAKAGVESALRGFEYTVRAAVRGAVEDAREWETDDEDWDDGDWDD
jgi:hypothetical protein